MIAMLMPRYFRYRIALAFALFSAFLSTLFCFLILSGIEKSDDNVREELISTHAERLLQYYQETQTFWAKHQLTGIDVLIEGRDLIPEEIYRLPEGYFEEGGKDLYIYATSVRSQDTITKVFLVHQGLGNDWAEQYEDVIYLLLAVVTLLVTVTGSLVGLSISRKISEPLQDLTAQIRSTDPNAPTFKALPREDEFGEIGRAFENTVQRINDVLEREKQFSRYASHELRTPVAIINSSINLWNECKDSADGDATEKLKQRVMDRVTAANQQMEDVIQTFLVLSNKDIDWGQASTIDLSATLDALTQKYSYLNGADHISVIKNYKQSNHIQLQVAHEQAVKLIISNVLRNAFDYCATQIEVSLNASELIVKNDIDDLRVEQSEHFGFGLKIIGDLSALLEWSVDQQQGKDGEFIIQLSFNDQA